MSDGAETPGEVGPRPIDETIGQSPTPGPTDLTIDHAQTPGPTDPDDTADGQYERLARGSTVRYFGDYEVQKELGRGGMGVVYQARQVSLNRSVALKMIKAGLLADPAELKRFENEAEAIALLDHAGVVPVYEVGEHDGQRYFTMKLLEGGNLAEHLASFKDNPRAAATLLAETAEAVHHAHMRGILHRDLKPANILIDAGGHPHVTDFGLAKRVEGDIEMTRSGAILGTPAYMSPEQATGRRGSITTATDVYGLGAILYALLTGKAPFGGDSVIETLDAVRTRPPEPPKKLNAHIPRDLETICLKCLEKDPRRRYASAHELADELENWLDSRPIRARRVGVAERVWLWHKRQPAVAALAVAVVLAALGGTGAVIAVQIRANRILEKKNTDLKSANTALDRQRDRAEDRENQAIDAVKKFRDAVVNEPALKNTSALDGLRKRLLKEPLAFFRTLRDRLQADRDTRPESLARLAQASLDLGALNNEIGDKADALRDCQESLAILTLVARENPSVTKLQNDLAVTQNNLGNLQSDTGRPMGALAAHEHSRAIWERLARENPSATQYQSKLAGSYMNIGDLQHKTGRPREALASAERARAILERLALANPSVTEFQTTLAKCYNNIGAVQRATGRPAEALASLKQFRDIQDRLARANPSVTEFQRHLALSHYNIGDVLRAAGHPAEALTSFEQALAIRERLVLANPSVTEFQNDLAMSYHSIGELQRDTGQPEKAFAPLQRARGIREALTRANPSVPEFQRNLGRSHGAIGLQQRRIGQPAEALASYERAREIQERLAREHPELPDRASELGGTLNNIAVIYLFQRQFDEARTRLKPAVEWQRKALSANPKDSTYRMFLANHLTNLIHAEEGLGRAVEADEARRELAELSASDPAKLALDARLAAVLKGEPPRSNAERLALAQRAYEKSLHATAARLWAEALVADPKLGDDRQAVHRYNAACAASLAASGQGKDDPPPDAAARAKLRRQALDVLKAELAVWTKLVEHGPPQARTPIVPTLKHWQEDADLAGIRGENELAKLPDEERKDWQSLWADVAALLKRARADTP